VGSVEGRLWMVVMVVLARLLVNFFLSRAFTFRSFLVLPILAGIDNDDSAIDYLWFCSYSTPLSRPPFVLLVQPTVYLPTCLSVCLYACM
jgi:hypothetical protein